MRHLIECTLQWLDDLIKPIPKPVSHPSALVSSLALCLGFSVTGVVLAGQTGARFIRFEEVREIISAFSESDAATLPSGGLENAAAWDAWIRTQDTEIRERIDRGFEDSISNLILYGTSYTRLPRLEGFEEIVLAGGELTEAARARVHGLAVALPRSPDNERIRLVGDFLARRKVPAGSVENYLSANLQRFVAEQLAYQEKLRIAGQSGDPSEVFLTRGTLFQKRGLSVDTSLLPNFALQETLQALARKGVLSPRRIRRIAVIGPGLDFTDKRDGYDFYPLQTIQPFAILEALLRLRLAAPGHIKIVTLDLNPAVTAHVRRLAERARAGHPYIIQLPRDSAGEWNPAAIAYWEHFGEIIGSRTAPLPIPKTLSGVALRAVAIHPIFATQLESLDLDIVTQTLDLPPQAGSGFDLVVATNILVYYNRFEQSVAMASIARMMNSGGIFLANNVLPAQHPESLEYLGRHSTSYSETGAFGDDVVVYRRR
ncbi:MAG TPA: hypothetical protein VGV68_11735 [Terriglobia bacterium]|nr:hypothetical protein [Terriglobia bacterium]